MHLYLRAIGLSKFNTRKSVDKLMKDIIKETIEKDEVEYFEEPLIQEEKDYHTAQIRHYFNKVSGLSLNGLYNPKRKIFKLDYYFPFLDSTVETFEENITVRRRTDQEAYNVFCDEPGMSLALIFYLSNPIKYFTAAARKDEEFFDYYVRMAAMSNEGHIVLPLAQDENQQKKYDDITQTRSTLMARARKGDRTAIDDLTIEDMDTYTEVYKRVRYQDILTVVNSSLMPNGFECDTYSVIGTIQDVHEYTNSLTQEKIYVFTLESNDVVYDMCINQIDLVGIPEKGRRFVGNIWLQGQAGVT